ncbi:putative short-chain dehydrogenase [Thozetella sp. PMI_491]|nr:putative short-chain dehydrogenase [Thozetella sp. PMI_491]
MTKPVLLLLGAGPNLGKNVTDTFILKGWRVALVSRSTVDLQDTSILQLKANLSEPSSIATVFEKVRLMWDHPTVVLYNGASRTLLAAEDPLAGLDMDQYQRDMAINITNALVAAQYAVEGFKLLPPSDFKTFFYTGNKLPSMSAPAVMHFGVGKSAAAHMIWDCSTAYQKQGYKFYFTSERLPDGKPAREGRSGKAAAEVCLHLVETPEQQ